MRTVTRSMVWVLLVLCCVATARPVAAAELYLRSGQIPVYDSAYSTELREIGRIEGARPAAELARFFRLNERLYRIEDGDLEGNILVEDVLLSAHNPDDEGVVQLLPPNVDSFFGTEYQRSPLLTNNGRYLISSDRAFLDLELERVVMRLGPVDRTGMGQSVVTQSHYVSTSTGTSDQSRLIAYDADNISLFEAYSAFDYGLERFETLGPVGAGDVVFVSGPEAGSSNGGAVLLLAIDAASGEEVFRERLADGWSGRRLRALSDGRYLMLQAGFFGRPYSLHVLDPVDLEIDGRLDVAFDSACRGGSPDFSVFEDERVVQIGMRCANAGENSYFAGVDLDSLSVLWNVSGPGIAPIAHTDAAGFHHSPNRSEAFAADPRTGERTSEPRPAPNLFGGETRRSYTVQSPDGSASVTLRGTFWVRHFNADGTYSLIFRSGLRPELSIEVAAPGMDKTIDVAFPRREWADFDHDANMVRAVTTQNVTTKSYFEWTLGSPEIDVALPLPERVFWLSPPGGERRSALVIDDLEDADRRTFNIVPLAPESRVATDGAVVPGDAQRQSTQSCYEHRGRQVWTRLVPHGSRVFMNHCVIDTDSDDGSWTMVDDLERFQPKRCDFAFGAPPCRSWNLDDIGPPHRVVGDGEMQGLVSYGLTDGNEIAMLVQRPNRQSIPTHIVLDFMERDFQLFGADRQNDNAKAYVLPSEAGRVRLLVRGVPRGAPLEDEFGNDSHPSTLIYAFDLEGNQLGEPENAGEQLMVRGLIQSEDIASDENAVVIAQTSGGLFFHDRALRPLRAHPRQPQMSGGRLLMGGGHAIVPRSETGYDVFRSSTGERVASLFLEADGDALLLLPSGFFAFNRISAAAQILVRNSQTNAAVPLSAFAEEFYRPDLVQAAFAGDPGGALRDARSTLSLKEAFEVGAPPQVVALDIDAESTPKGSIRARARLDVGAGGLGWVVWRVNGEVVAVDESQATPDGVGPLEVSRVLPLEQGANEVSVAVSNASRILTSRPATAQGPAFDGEAERGRVHLLTVAVADYGDDALDLAYPNRDADAFAAALRQAMQAGSSGPMMPSLAGRDLVVTRLSDGEVTRASVSAAMRAIAADMHPDDTFVLFAAGHGLTDEGRFHFLGADIRTGRDPRQELAQRAISQGEWNRLLSLMPARRAIVVFDACESGSALRMDAAFRLHQAIANGATGARSTRLMMSASTETQYALEGHEGHGAFTSTLLDAFVSGDRDGDGVLTTEEVSDYVRRELPRLTYDKWNYRQTPQISLTGEAFALGAVTGG